MAAPTLSASYVKPAPTIACALQNVPRGSKKSLQSVSVMEVGIASRGIVGSARFTSQGRAFGSFENMNRGFYRHQLCRGWSRRSSTCGMRVQASAAAIETTGSPKVAGAVACTLTTPLGVAKTQVMAQNPLNSLIYMGLPATRLQMICMKEGIVGFGREMVPHVPYKVPVFVMKP